MNDSATPRRSGRIVHARGDMLQASADALVNPVNTVGVMGAGLALQFKFAYPEVYRAYREEFGRGELRIGRMHVVPLGGPGEPAYVVNFPTKEHWRNPSQMGYITSGLADLVCVARRLKLRTIGIPPLGCGHGGLSWAAVRPLIEAAFRDEQVEVRLYTPARSRAIESLCPRR